MWVHNLMLVTPFAVAAMQPPATLRRLRRPGPTLGAESRVRSVEGYLCPRCDVSRAVITLPHLLMRAIESLSKRAAVKRVLIVIVRSHAACSTSDNLIFIPKMYINQSHNLSIDFTS